MLLLLLYIVGTYACAQYAPSVGSPQWTVEPSSFEVTWVWPTVGAPEGTALLYAQTYHYLYSASAIVELPQHVTGWVNITVTCINTHGGFASTISWSDNSPWSDVPWNLTCDTAWSNVSYSVPATAGQHYVSIIIQPDYSVESVLAIAAVSVVACTEPFSSPPAWQMFLMVVGIVLALGVLWTLTCCLYQRQRRRHTYAHIAMED